jgi:internalin A
MKDQEVIRELERILKITFQIQTTNSEFDVNSSSVVYNDENKAVRIHIVLKNIDKEKERKSGNKNELRFLRPIPEQIFELKSLQYLSLPTCNISFIPHGILSLKYLKKIDLAENGIKKFEPWLLDLGLPILNVKSIDEFFNLDEGINLGLNPLESPPLEIVDKGNISIKSYFESLSGKRGRTLNEVKVILIGDGSSGKTSLVKRITNNDFDINESQTHGINITEYFPSNSQKKIKINFWDFGGQDIMHATHQFFLSKRSIYILLLNAREEPNPEYWLKHIESFGGDSPIIIAINKSDENPSFDINRKFLKSKYPSIFEIFTVSCFNGIGILGLKEALIQSIVQLKHLNTTWAESWFTVKGKLENMEDPYISYDDYIILCEQQGINDKISQDTLISYLNDLGVALFYPDFELNDTHVLDPLWVTEGVYRIINSKLLAESKGLLLLNKTSDILDKKSKSGFLYPREKHKFIIDLMKKFELCYELNQNTILVPDLLQVQEPNFDTDQVDGLKFEIEYNFLPKSIFPRFLVKIHKDIYNNLEWRTGVIIEDKAFESKSLIRVDYETRKIYISVKGKQQRDYFSAILYTIRQINNSFAKMEVKEKIPLPDNQDVSVSYSHLIKLEKEGIKTYYPDGADKIYNVNNLLGTIKKEEGTEEEILLLLNKIKTDLDNKETLVEKANQIIQLQPNFMGFGLNVNALIDKIMKKDQKNKILKK